MFKTTAEADAFCQGWINLPRVPGCEVHIYPPYTALATVKSLLSGRVELGAQNVHANADGAFTGEISVRMLEDVGCRWALVGHSERRHVFGETDALIAQKVKMVLSTTLRLNLCVGETQAEREAGRTQAVVMGQLQSALAGVAADAMDRVVLSYEPVWAIGTGVNATGDQAQEVCASIRAEVLRLYGTKVAEATRILYGGSVKPANIAEFTRHADVDGALVGGASLVAESFHQIVVAGQGAAR